jgi:hypothetical protein
MLPPPAPPSSAFDALTNLGHASGAGAVGSPATNIKLVPAEAMDQFKRLLLEHCNLPKIGLTEVLAHTIKGVTKAQVKNTLELVAEKKALRGAWELKPGFGLSPN